MPTDWQILTATRLAKASDAEVRAYLAQLAQARAEDQQVHQLRYYLPVSPFAEQIHRTTAKTIGVGGGNGSSKTDSCLAEIIIRATGQIPLSLREHYPREKLRGPIAARIVCESLTTTLRPIILPKLQWWKWSGVGQPGSDQGHWGWIPQDCLPGGEWKKAWSERFRTLTVLYRDPDEPARIVGESLLQFMSYDQDPSDFASGDFHVILHDEPPKYDIWRENRARVMRVNGTLMVSMTWPDDPAINLDWLMDELYDPAQQHKPGYFWIDLYTTDNPNLNQTAVAERAAQMSHTERLARIYGQPIRLSNRIHPLFTDQPKLWCHACRECVAKTDRGDCATCRDGQAVLSFCHVQPLLIQPLHPVLCLLDPHPRKDHKLLWVQIDPNDDWHVVMERSLDCAPADLWQEVQDVEHECGWFSITRLMDPNMGRQNASTDRTLTWQDAFDRAGVRFDLADDSEVGRELIDQLLRPDPCLQRPRLLVDPRCEETIYQLKRYLWDDFKSGADRDQKQRPKQKHDDFPTLLRYAANSTPTYRGLKQSWSPHARPAILRSVKGY